MRKRRIHFEYDYFTVTITDCFDFGERFFCRHGAGGRLFKYDEAS